MVPPDQGPAGGWTTRLLYRDDYRDTLRWMILDAMAMGVQIPDDMPADTTEHVQAAIVYVARLTGMRARGMSL